MTQHTSTLLDRLRFNLPSLWAIVKRCLLRKRKPLRVRSAEETLRYILDARCSVARYGDGEFRIMRGGDIAFQASTPDFRKRLWDILRNPRSDCLLCVPDVFASVERLRAPAVYFWKRMLRLQRAWVEQTFGGEYHYGDALISRFYMDLEDKRPAPMMVDLWKQVWEGREILIVEGMYSRLGMGSDLFANAASVKRILCPPIDAWDVYDEILAKTRQYARGRLVLISLGPTATVLAYDLAKEGLQAIDCGHFEVEYQWMLMGATEKVPIANHWINEIGGLSEEETSNEMQLPSDVLATIGLPKN